MIKLVRAHTNALTSDYSLVMKVRKESLGRLDLVSLLKSLRQIEEELAYMSNGAAMYTESRKLTRTCKHYQSTETLKAAEGEAYTFLWSLQETWTQAGEMLAF
jgi:hypothetical protein